MSRIKLDMSTMDIIVELAEGNPGAINVIMGLLKDGATVDPDAAFGPIHSLLDLDHKGIYGPSIWMLFKDVCEQDITRVIALLRCDQLGIKHFKEGDLHNREKVQELKEFAKGATKLVQAELPNFAPGA